MKTPDDEHLEKSARSEMEKRVKRKRRSPEVIAAEKRAWLERHEWGGARACVERLNKALDLVQQTEAAKMNMPEGDDVAVRVRAALVAITALRDSIHGRIPEHLR